MKFAAVAEFVLVGLAVGQTIRPIPHTRVRVVGEILTKPMQESMTAQASRPTLRAVNPLSHAACVNAVRSSIIVTLERPQRSK